MQAIFLTWIQPSTEMIPAASRLMDAAGIYPLYKNLEKSCYFSFKQSEQYCRNYCTDQ